MRYKEQWDTRVIPYEPGRAKLKKKVMSFLLFLSTTKNMLPFKPKNVPTIYQITAETYMILPMNIEIQLSLSNRGKKNNCTTYRII